MEELIYKLKEAFDEVAPFIERHTRRVCPECQKVCCIDRHGRYDDEDLLFINSLEEQRTALPDRAETEQCRFLDENGCSLPRRLRPFRCTWYFCPPLLDSMRADRGRDYREFVERLRRLQELRRGVLAHSTGHAI
jgi:hypothetical protein